MNTIKLNNNEYEISSYSKNTSFYNDTPSSTAYFTIIANNSNVIDGVNALANTTITSLEITYDGDVIYSLSNISAKIESINETLNTSRMDVNVNIKFENALGA